MAPKDGDRRGDATPGMPLRLLLTCGAVLLLLWGGVQAWESMLRGGGGRSEAARLRPKPAVRLRATTSADALRAFAEHTARELVDDFPNDAQALDVLANVQLSLGRRSEARALWEKCRALDPENEARYLAAMAQAAEAGGEHADAARLYAAACGAGGKDPQWIVSRAENLMKAGQVRASADLLTAEASRQPLPAEAMTLLGQCHDQLGDAARAKAAFEVALQLDPDDRAAHYGLARVQLQQGEREAAEQSLERFRALQAQADEQRVSDLRDFNDPAAAAQITYRMLRGAAECYSRHEQFERAEQLLHEAVALLPSHTGARFDLMVLYDRAGFDHDALAMAESLRRMAPDNADFWMHTGMLRARTGDYDAALDAVRQAIAQAPDNPRYRDAYRLIQRGR